MINVLFVCHDMINRGPGAYSGIVFIGKIKKNAIKSIVDY